jgi:hypothetical protein
VTPVDFRNGGADFERRNVASPRTSYGRANPNPLGICAQIHAD